MSRRAARRGRLNLLARLSVHRDQPGQRRPGSQNPHKSASKDARKRGAEWAARTQRK